MKLKKWLAILLAAALVLPAMSGQRWTVLAEETEQEQETAEKEKSEEELSGEDEQTETSLTADDEQTPEKDLPAESPQDSEDEDEVLVTDPSVEEESSSTTVEEEQEETETGEEGEGFLQQNAALENSSALQTTPPTENTENDIQEEMEEPETLNKLPKEDETGEPVAQAEDIASGTDGSINWRIDADGKLTVNGTGDFTSTTEPWDQYRDQIISVEVHITGMTDASAMFSSCSNLSSLDVSDFDTSNVTDMGFMFAGCSNLSSVDVSNFDTSNVTDMSYMFNDCSSLSSVDVSNFDTSNVTNMSHMFSDCSSLSSVDVSNFDTSNVVDIEGIFNLCNNLSSVDVSNFETSNVTNMGGMFRGCNSLSSVDVSNFETSNVMYMGDMFRGCSSLSSVDVSNFNTSDVTDMRFMFAGCSNLSSVDVSNFETLNVMYMEDMFRGCSSLSSVDVSNFDTSNVTSMYCMFGDCNSLSSVDVSNFETSNVMNMGYMFSNCSSLSSVDVSNFDTSNVMYMEGMFDGCSNLTEIHSPYNIHCDVELPTGTDIFWLLPDGTEVTKLPQNLTYSVTIIRRRNLEIITTTPDLNMSDVIRLKYVPYSYTVETNNWDENNKVTFSVVEGELAKGLKMYPVTGEIYGVPQEAGEFPIRVKAEFSNPEYLPSYADLTLTVLDNTDSRIFAASDPGYEVEQYIGTKISEGQDVYYTITKSEDQLFVSAGDYGEFIDLWLNGVKLIEGIDYTKESGSTRITIRKQTFENKADQNGTNTIAAEFRVGGDRNNDLKRTTQNFRIDIQQGGNGSSGGGTGNEGSGGGSGGSSDTAVAAVSTATVVVRLVDAAGNPLTGATLELHSTPQTAQTDGRGAAAFGGVPADLHTLYVKDTAGNILASRGFELLFGDHVSLNGDQVTVKAGTAFTFQVQMSGNELFFLGVQEGDIYQISSADTGDDADPELWLALLAVSCVATACVLGKRRRQRADNGR